MGRQAEVQDLSEQADAPWHGMRRQTLCHDPSLRTEIIPYSAQHRLFSIMGYLNSNPIVKADKKA